MKKIFIILLGFILFSCDDDFLELTPKDQITDKILWEDSKVADLFLNGVYSGLPGPFNTSDPMENYSDNSMCGINGSFTRSTIANANYTPSTAPSQWGLYSSIRSSNVFIKKASESDLPDDWKQQRLGEARFLRAYYYSILWTWYGGVPIITDVLDISTQGDEIFHSRNTAEETFRFIVDECEDIANDLPLSAEAGRATRGAALSLKGWCELFWASPLYNPDNDKTKWAAAAETYKKVIDLGVYSLFPDYNAMFWEVNDNNEEVIFDKQYLGGTDLGHSREGLQGPHELGYGEQLSWGGVNPTQELVDEYCMENGLPISDPESGYDPQNPYFKREKRFYQSIVYDGAPWLGGEMIIRQGVGSTAATDIYDQDERTNTGYYLGKGLDPQYCVNGPLKLNGSNFIIFRYGEILLSYAEAQNEAVGPDASVYDAVNQVRQRSDLPPLQEGMTQEEMRTAIYRERRVELAFEEKRWFDLVRLKMAEEKLNGTFHAMLIEQENDIWVYKIIPAPAGTRTFYPEKNYVFPIPQSAMDRNTNLVQNPNYD
jgi:hypothetical protein